MEITQEELIKVRRVTMRYKNMPEFYDHDFVMKKNGWHCLRTVIGHKNNWHLDAVWEREEYEQALVH